MMDGLTAIRHNFPSKNGLNNGDEPDRYNLSMRLSYSSKALQPVKFVQLQVYFAATLATDRLIVFC